MYRPNADVLPVSKQQQQPSLPAGDETQVSSITASSRQRTVLIGCPLFKSLCVATQLNPSTRPLPPVTGDSSWMDEELPSIIDDVRCHETVPVVCINYSQTWLSAWSCTHRIHARATPACCWLCVQRRKPWGDGGHVPQKEGTRPPPEFGVGRQCKSSPRFWHFWHISLLLRTALKDSISVIILHSDCWTHSIMSAFVLRSDLCASLFGWVL